MNFVKSEKLLPLTRRELLAAFLAAPACLNAASPTPNPNREALLYGGTPPPKWVELQAGPTFLIFEPETAFVRHLRVGDDEILIGLYAAVRDRNWNTVLPVLSNVRIEQSADSFKTSFQASCKSGPVDFAWKGTLSGEADGTVRFTFDGSALSTFLRNRIGFCVLHSASAAGEPVQVEQVSGKKLESKFPDDISPNQPLFDIRALTQRFPSGMEAEVRMLGDAFEMEDQRNWTDASYKTYCTPLGLPYPVEVKAGLQIKQEIVITVRSASAGRKRVSSTPSREVELSVQRESSNAIPAIGLGVSSESERLSTREVALLKRLAPAHLRADVLLGTPDFARKLQSACEQSRSLGTSIELAVHLNRNPEEELRSLVEALRKNRAPIRHYLIFHQQEKSTSAKWLDLARKHLSSFEPRPKLSAGTDAYFTELNRGRPTLQGADGITYSLNPQVHAFDNHSLMETVETQATTLQSARKFCGHLPLMVSSVTLKPRFNPNATAAPVKSQGPMTQLPDEVDQRQPSLFAGAWTVGSLKYLAEGGAASVTYFETTGWRGVLASASGSPLPEKFVSKPGAAFPIFHVLTAAADFAGGKCSKVQSSRKLDVVGTCFQKSGKHRLILANLTAEPKVARVTIPDFGPNVRLRFLDETTAEAASEKPEEFWNTKGSLLELRQGVMQVGLLPYAILFADA